MSSTEQLGKYFLVRSKVKPELVLSIRDGVDKQGTPLVLGEYNNSYVNHQMWFKDFETGTIRSKLNNLCIDVKEDVLLVLPYSQEASSQCWVVTENKICQKDDSETVISVRDGIPNTRDACSASRYTGTDGQHWTVEHCPAQYFYIRSTSDVHKVFDVKGDSTKPGSKVIIFTDKGNLADNQLWFEDESSIICSKINGFALEARGNDLVTMTKDAENTNQQWVISGSCVRNRADPDRVLEMKPGGMIFGEPSLVVAKLSHNQKHQNWKFTYVGGNSKQLNHPGTGKHYTIRNRANGLVLEVQGRDPVPNAAVVTAVRVDEAEACQHQVFYTEDSTSTIRTALGNFCVDNVDGNLVINPFDPYDKNMQWRISGHRIQNRDKQNLAWSVAESSGSEPGARVSVGPYTDDELQLWDISYLPAKSFYIVSQMHGKVLDVCGDNASTGARVIMFDKKDSQCLNQLWYEDEQGILRSKLNGYVLDSTSGLINLQPFDSKNTLNYWIIVGDRIQNKYDTHLVLDIKGESKSDRASLCAFRYMDGDNQRWKFDYV